MLSTARALKYREVGGKRYFATQGEHLKGKLKTYALSQGKGTKGKGSSKSKEASGTQHHRHSDTRQAHTATPKEHPSKNDPPLKTTVKGDSPSNHTSRSCVRSNKHVCLMITKLLYVCSIDACCKMLAPPGYAVKPNRGEGQREL